MATEAEKPSAPDYLSELDSAHRAHASEMRTMIGELPIHRGHRVLDMGCGDGAYLELLAERVGPGGTVVGLDSSLGCITVATKRLEGRRAQIELVAGTIDALPLAGDSFDFIWCAKSLVSFPQPEFAIEQMVRCLKPGGTLAILETDSLHEVTLPWPEDLELAIRQAELDAYRDRVRRPDKRYIARRLQSLLGNAGLTDIRRRTYAIDRTAPLGEAEIDCLVKYLTRLREKVLPYLDPRYQSEFGQLIRPQSSNFLGRTLGFGMTWFEVVCTGIRP